MRASKFILLMVATLCAFPFAAAIAVDRDAIILALPFDEGKGRESIDISSHGNHGVLSETAKWAQGKIGMCVRLKGRLRGSGESPKPQPAQHGLHAGDMDNVCRGCRMV